MEVFSCKACKALFFGPGSQRSETERVEHCIDAQSWCLGLQVQTFPTCLPAKMYHGNF